MRRILLTILLLLAALFGPECAWSTTVTGTVMQNGQPVTGYIDFSLVYPSTNGSSINLPGSPGHIPIYNGQVPTQNIPGNDTLLPRGTYYQVTYYDAYAQPIARSNYVITGATYDIGAAIPTPVTTSNINFLDLLGLRNVSIQNLTISNSLTIGATTYGATGITGAQQINDFRFASGFLVGSSTCGIAEAQANLPATGGIIFMQAGNCTMTAGVTITKAVILWGMGTGATTLTNGTTGSNLITLSSTNAGMRDLTVFGNRGAPGVTGGDNIDIINGTKVTLDHVISTNATFQGLYVNGIVTQPTILNSQFTGNAQNGIFLDGTQAIDQTTVTGSVLSNNGGTGLAVSNTGPRTVVVTDSVLSNNAQSGIFVTGGATNAHLKAYRNSADGNPTAGINLAGGFGHVVESNQTLVGAHQAYGINVTAPALGDTLTTIATIIANTTTGNTTADIHIGSTPSYVLFYPQTEVAGGSANYQFDNPSAVHLITPATTPAPPTILYRDLIITSGICTTSGSSYGTCTTGTFSWTTPFADANYTVTCSGLNPTGSAITGIFPQSKTASGFAIKLQNGTADGAHPVTFAEIDCHGSHP